MKKYSPVLLLIVVFSMIFFSSCKDSDKSPTEQPLVPTMNTVTHTGQLTVVQGSNLLEGDFKVLSFSSSTDVGDDGNFTLEANEANKFQMLLFNSETGNNTVYIGLFNPTSDEVIANDTSTVLALTLFNPYLIYADQAQKELYLEEVLANTKFPQLLSAFRNACISNASAALDYSTNPVIYQLTAQLMKETMESLAGQPGPKEIKSAIGEPPYIEDVEGESVNFVNPRHVYYAAGIYPDNGALSTVVTVNRKETIASYNWDWPPVINTEPEVTNYNLGNGYFKIYLSKGMDFTKITQFDDPVGRATLLNTAQVLLYVIELMIGELPLPPPTDLPNNITISSDRATALTLNITDQDVEGFLINLCGLIQDNATNLGHWFWQNNNINAASQYIISAHSVLNRMLFVLELLGYTNEQGPFIWDLVYAPKDITYYITQTGGEIDTNATTQNNPPEAEFVINPPAGIVGTVFTFNSSSSIDDNDALADLEFRWDWQSDGIWDTSWSGDTTATHTYTTAGAYLVSLEVRDGDGLIGAITHTVNVGGGAGTATHVKLFRDGLPWSSNSMVTMLESLGFTVGTGPNTYEIITSAEIDSVELIPGEDLVIISNDQNQTFYNNYAASQIRFTNFVYMGGSLFWEACDEGWAYGSIVNAGIVLPGNLVTTFDYDYWNYVTDQNLPLVAGLPNSMDHNYASHESFSNLPDGTTVYCIDESNGATLIEFNLGAGWIVVTGQPLEHQYENVYGAADMAELLPRIVAYFTGKTISKPLAKRSLPRSQRSTHD